MDGIKWMESKWIELLGAHVMGTEMDREDYGWLSVLWFVVGLY